MLAVALALAIASALVFGIWRLLSRRATLPCPAFLSWLVELDNPLFRNNRASVIVAHLDVRPGMHALDVGCGPGRLTIPLAKAVGPSGKVVAVDIQPAMLEKAAAKAARANLTNIEFVQARIGTGELPSNAFDRAVLVTVLGEIPGREAALREIFDCLKPGGVLAVTEVIADPHFQSRKVVRGLAAQAGFKERLAIGGSLSFTIYFKKPD